MQPWIDYLISPAQTAFVPGREISENIILLREILHSFKSMNGGEGNFVLKVDLAKAFDRVEWRYLFSLLPYYGFSPTLCKWIEACVTSSKFTILFDGKGDGFLKPKRGLRQGCAMSPYLFIISMDPLSRMLEASRKVGNLNGLKLARSALPLTNSMFADDLLLMGGLNFREVDEYVRVMSIFCSMSGMAINPSKSKVWFSANSDQVTREWFLQYMQIQEVEAGESFLGCPVKVTANSDFDYIVEKFQTRLSSWKSRLLSHAGRLILLKSVLESLPVYAMGTVIFPAKVIAKLTAIMREFFWGSTDDKKKMPYVAWEKITKPKGLGGLGLRSLKELNQALVMKNVWKIVSGHECQWVRVIESKYYPRGTFWGTCRRTNCSKLWPQLIELREVIRHEVAWRIGDGANMAVFSQPWFPQWNQFIASTREQREMKVLQLIDPDTHDWNFQILQQVFGFSVALSIATNDVIRPNPAPGQDCLLFTFAKDGKFTVKTVYHMLKGTQIQSGDKEFWNWMWGQNGLLPKFKLFIWRCCLNAIPVHAIISRRISSLSSQCKLCGSAEESITHTLFHCNFARSAWLASPLGIRSDCLTGSFEEIVRGVRQVLGDREFPKFISITWAVWRSRNEATYAGRTQTLKVCREYWQRAMDESLIFQSGTTVQQQCRGLELGQYLTNQPLVSTGYHCFVDGSWDESGEAGVGLVLINNGEIKQWVSKSVQAVSPSQAEAFAVLMGLKALQQGQISGGIVHSDSADMVRSLSGGFPNIFDWRSYGQIWEAWRLIRGSQFSVSMNYCPRENEYIKIAHNLANQGRQCKWDRQGTSLIDSDILM